MAHPPWLGSPDNTRRQRLREFCYEPRAKRGKTRQAVMVESCFAPLLAWVLSLWEGTQLALALEATPLGDRFTVQVISVMSRGCAKTLVPQPGCQWSGTGVAFKGRQRRLCCTLLARWEPGYRDPWLILTELPPAVGDVCWYSLRAWIENWIKMLKNDFASDRTSAHHFLANHLRLFFACGASVLHHALGTEVLVHPELAQSQPATVILKRFKIAVRVVPYQDRIKPHLPSSCPVKALLHQVIEILFQIRAPVWNTS